MFLYTLGIALLIWYVQTESGNLLDRKKAVALLKELVTKQLIQPSLVLIEKRKPDSYQLEIKATMTENKSGCF